MRLTETRINNAQLLKTTIGEAEILFGIVRGDGFRGTSIPLTPNPRSFCGRSNKNYSRMLSTIINEPEMFIHKNASGIVVRVSDYSIHEDGGVSLFFDEDHDGILNGGHTYEILRNFGVAKSHVKMHVVKGLSEEKMVDVVESLNLSKRIELYSLENKRGRFDWHKEALGEAARDISYHEGDTGLLDVRESVGSLNLFLRSREGVHNPGAAYRGSVNVNYQAFRKLEQEFYSNQVVGIARDIHELHRFIVTNPHILSLCDISNVKGWKRRLPNGERGLIRAVTNLVLLGMAVAGTEYDEGEVKWRVGFNTRDLRFDFAASFFHKVFDVVVLEAGILSHVCKRQEVIERVVRQAEIVSSQRRASVQMTLV